MRVFEGLFVNNGSVGIFLEVPIPEIFNDNKELLTEIDNFFSRVYKTKECILSTIVAFVGSLC